MLTLPSALEQRAFVSSLARERFRSFRRAVGGSDRLAVELYLVDAEIASLMHATIRGVEVLLRERMHRALSAKFGPTWYHTEYGRLDRRSKSQIDKARADVGSGAPPGKVVAQLMFGTWTNLLDAGGPLTNMRTGPHADYETDFWDPALSGAFSSQVGTPITRPDVHALAQTLNWARNRINHCEPVVFGFPQPGQSTGPGQLRKTPARVMADARQLLSLLDADVAVWMARWHTVDRLVRDPIAQSALAAPSPGVNLQH